MRPNVVGMNVDDALALLRSGVRVQVPVRKGIDRSKPKLSVDELAAKKRRCGEAKAAGLPCTEFAKVPAMSVTPTMSTSVSLKWAYGVTAVAKRKDDLLPRTLASLAAGGFDKPRLFVDGSVSSDVMRWKCAEGLDVTCRYPNVKTYGNWVLALWEMYLREPTAQMYAIFQDDMVTVKNLRQYLEQCQRPERGYLNLYTFPSNQDMCPKGPDGRQVEGFYRSNQLGRGAVATVIPHDGVMALLSSAHMVERVTDAHRAHRSVDGGVVSAMIKAGWSEYVHNPSLVQHTGESSTMGNAKHRLAVSFPGEGFDALSVLTK